MRRLKARFSLESRPGLLVGFGMTDGTFDYVSRVRWYQFWRWRILLNLSESYLKSRIRELDLAKVLAEKIRSGIEENKGV